MKLGWPTTRTIFRTCGWISRTVGGFETLVKSILSLLPQPGAARAARRQNASRRQPRNDPGPGPGARRIRDLRVRGRCIRNLRQSAFGASVHSGDVAAVRDVSVRGLLGQADRRAGRTSSRTCLAKPRAPEIVDGVMCDHVMSLRSDFIEDPPEEAESSSLRSDRHHVAAARRSPCRPHRRRPCGS